MLRHLGLVFFASAFVASSGLADDAEATKRLDAVATRYKSLNAYEDHGILRVESTVRGDRTGDPDDGESVN